MIATIEHYSRNYKIDLSNPLDISIPIVFSGNGVTAYHTSLPTATPVMSGSFVGSVIKGGPVNFKDVKFNPHGNGTHTECVGHISEEPYSINQCLDRFYFVAELVTITPIEIGDNDKVITKDQLEKVLTDPDAEAIIIRTIPNSDSKRSTDYSGKNPPYIHHEAMELLVNKGVKHLLIDVPSVDKEEDNGALLAHKAFWGFPQKIRQDATITELVYIKNEIQDDTYILNLSFASFELDASPSKPILYKLI